MEGTSQPLCLYPTSHKFQRLANCLTDQHPIIDVAQLSGDGTVAYSGVFNVHTYLPYLSSDGARFLKVGVSGQSGIEEMGAITVRNGLSSCVAFALPFPLSSHPITSLLSLPFAIPSPFLLLDSEQSRHYEKGSSFWDFVSHTT